MPTEAIVTIAIHVTGLAMVAGMMWAKLSMLEKMVSRLTEKLDEYEQRLRQVEIQHERKYE